MKIEHSPSDAAPLERAARAVEAGIAKAQTDPARPAIHFRAPARWMNDPNGTIYHNGWYHVFYQLHPFSEGDGPKHWGHARTRDLVHWQHLPIALWPSRELGEEQCWSGSAAIRDDGTPMLFYTSIGPTHQPLDSAEQWAALGDPELLRWQKHPANPLLTEKLHGGVKILDWRDPFVFREAGRWYLVLGGHREGGRGCIDLYTSADLERWTYLGIPLEGEEENWECPNLFRIGERWVLLYSPHSVVKYYTGTLDLDACRFTPERHGGVDHGVFYASNVLRDARGRWILWGWERAWVEGRGWNGCLALPRIVSLTPDGRLVQQPAPELHCLRRDRVSASDLRLSSGSHSLPQVAGDCLEVRARLEPAGAGAFGLRLGGREDLTIRCDGDALDVAGTIVPLEEAGGVGPLDLHVFVDRSLLEVFVNGQATVSRWFEHLGALQGVEAFAEGGGARVASIEAWRLEPVWTS